MNNSEAQAIIAEGRNALESDVGASVAWWWKNGDGQASAGTSGGNTMTRKVEIIIDGGQHE